MPSHLVDALGGRNSGALLLVEGIVVDRTVVEDDLVGRLDRLFPGAAERVVFRESATPVTHSRYTGASDGTGYGLAATPEQFMRNRPGYRTPIEGLYLCGASTRAGHGIVGAMKSGYSAARKIARDLEVTPPTMPRSAV